jgi:hypothetical protein
MFRRLAEPTIPACSATAKLPPLRSVKSVIKFRQIKLVVIRVILVFEPVPVWLGN